MKLYYMLYIYTVYVHIIAFVDNCVILYETYKPQASVSFCKVCG